MDHSLFCALRIVAHVLAVDGKVDSHEKRWFIRLMKTNEVSLEQMEILEKDLLEPGDIAKLHKEIYRAKDREKLMEWVRSAIVADGKIDPKEREIQRQIEKLNGKFIPVVDSSNSAYAAAILDYEKENRMWRDLQELGEFYSQRVRPFRRNYDFQALSSRNKYIVVTWIGLGVLVALARILARNMGWF